MTRLLKGRLKIWRLPVLVWFTAIFPFPLLSLPCVVPNIVFHSCHHGTWTILITAIYCYLHCIKRDSVHLLNQNVHLCLYIYFNYCYAIYLYKCAINYVLSYHENIHVLAFDSNLHNNEGLINNSIKYRIY